MIRKLLFILLVVTIHSCSVFKPIPQPEREFRGFWVATVVNIDWPKNGNDAIEKQKLDYLKILDFYDDLNFNAAIVQIRTAGDAFYDSDYAPWSRFLTGKEGQSPNSDESILKWMIDEAHVRGMEFHAWLNPYRATFDLKTEILSPIHDYNLHPEWMLKYGKKYYYNPGIPEVRDRMASVIDEIVTNFDIDAIHFDDYFYPYTIKDEVFNDSLTYNFHKLPNQSIDDWRRSNMDSLIKTSYTTIKNRKPWVQFGVSPFGVWKNKATDPNGSDTKAGQTTYENLYADPLLWMKEGWLDYLIPQVYWSMDLSVASHRKIVDWWSLNSQNTNLYIGNGPYKIRNNSDKAWDDPKELPKQLNLARNTENVKGNVFFSAKSLMKNNDDIVTNLQKKYYKRKALTPVVINSGTNSLKNIELKGIEENNVFTDLIFKNLEGYRYALVYPSGKKKRTEYSIKKLLTKVIVNENSSISIPSEISHHKKYVALTFIDYFGRKSEPVIVHLKHK
ncbi:family 10 glycosylhydrolase [Aurantibacter crassamenti]|uniref:glycoside hydrolase family 10 protein n=1 Tax=Aurantibacter crassamenti TaxID=1837375 RepID=UPI001939C4E2|nr:family 10 glycosylhydrolase [Aurantibacter crassamenti]MBM1106720.1 family 10 glycosylhydrolase [Aurantibacter crassamenti]